MSFSTLFWAHLVKNPPANAEDVCLIHPPIFIFYFFNFFFSGCGPFFKSLLNFFKYNTVYFLCFGFFARKACGILVP